MVEGIIKKSKHSDNHKVKINHPVSNTVYEMWISAEDITNVLAILTSKTQAEEPIKQKERRSDRRKSKYFLPYTKK